MKIFVSYSRHDSGDLAEQIYESPLTKGNDIFRDIDKIRAGEVWSKTIEDNISSCDIFIVILTPGALESSEVEKEVLLAKKNNKKIFPCFYSYLKKDEIKWELGTFQGIEFANKYELIRNAYHEISEYQKLQSGLDATKQETKVSTVQSETEIPKESKFFVPGEIIEDVTEVNKKPKVTKPSTQTKQKPKVTKPSTQTKQRPKARKTATQIKQRPKARKTATQIKQRPTVNKVSVKKTTKIERLIIRPYEIPEIIDKKDPRYFRLSALSTLHKERKLRWYQKLVTLNNDDKKFGLSKYCPQCKKVRSLHTNLAMNKAARPDMIGQCEVCGTILKWATNVRSSGTSKSLIGDSAPPETRWSPGDVKIARQEVNKWYRGQKKW